MTRLSASAGVLKLDGLPIKALGANAYSLFARRLLSSTPDAYQDVFGMLAAAGCRVVRVFGDGCNSASGMGLWQTDPAAARAHMQVLFDAAAASGIMLVWSLHWNIIAIPAWKSEANSALYTGGSATQTYMKKVIDECVPYFKDHSALAAWECGNEIPGLCVSNSMTVANAITIQDTILGWVRAHDDSGLVISGCSTADRTDISGQGGGYPTAGLASLQLQHAIFPTWSSHIYAERSGAVGVNGSSAWAWFERTAMEAKANGKPLVVGEFGPGSADPATSRTQTDAMVAGFVASSCQLGLIWNCDVADFSGNQANYIFNNTTRAYTLDLLSEHRALTYSARGAALSMCA